ncbi:37S ribosomal protein S22 [Orbilia javanica]|uniref:37S ribosomal protein S22 n=1 Tax=Orbilia javanica TaxID=47235 RepID=A0AAN8MFG8_9PEZI
MSTARRLTPQSVCLFCRLSSRLSKHNNPRVFHRRATVTTAGLTNPSTVLPIPRAYRRNFSTTRSTLQSNDPSTTSKPSATGVSQEPTPAEETISSSTSLPYIKSLRIKWQDTLPAGLLSPPDQRLWNTLYGEPKRWWDADEAAEIEGLMGDGMLFEEAVLLIDGVNAVRSGGEGEEEGGYTVENGVVSYYGPVDEEGRPLKRGGEGEEEVVMEGAEEVVVEEAVVEEFVPPTSFKDPVEEARIQALLDARAAAVEITKAFDTPGTDGKEEGEEYVRTHPLTLRGRFATYPSTVFVPKSLQNTTVSLLKEAKIEHLRDRAYLYNPPPIRAPTGAGTIKGLAKGGKSGYHPNLSPETHRGDKLDAAVWLGVVMPEVYAVNLGVATEIRRRLGGEWARGVKKVLDVGGGGAGILAWGDIVKAENMAEEERRLEEGSKGFDLEAAEGDEIVSTSEADGTWDWGHGIEGVQASSLDEDFKFEATVVTASPHVRSLASKVLANTTFLPRVPYFSAVHGNVKWDDSGVFSSSSRSAKESKDIEADMEEEDIGEVVWQDEAPSSSTDDKKQPPISPKRSYDLIFASYTLEHIKKENLFQHHIDNLWQLLTPGGVLCLVELGNVDGFNNIASARQRLLRKWIKSPLSEKKKESDEILEFDDISAPIEEDILGLGQTVPKPTSKEAANTTLAERLEDGMIVAPCTNHNECPMHSNQRTIFKSNDVCKFPQKYQRTIIAQRVVSGHTDHTNAFFSYLSVRRGVKKDETLAVEQATAKRRREAIEGDRKPKLLPMAVDKINKEYSEEQKRGYMHLQPRLVLPPIKGDHHVTLDVCTNHGDLERWIVPNSFSKKAYTDARKAKWGDLWVWGAKTKVVRESKKVVIEREREARKERGQEKDGERAVGVGKSKKKDGRKGWDKGKKVEVLKGRKAGNGRKINRVPFKKLVKTVEGYTKEKGRKEAGRDAE